MMQTDKVETGYNGYANYPTWNVALWLDNDQTEYEMVRNMARSWIHSEHPRYELSHWLKEYATEQNPLASDASSFADILGWALDQVDWYELADNYLQEATLEHLGEEHDDSAPRAYREVLSAQGVLDAHTIAHGHGGDH